MRRRPSSAVALIALAAMALVAACAATTPTPTPSGPTPPPFSRRITSAFPGSPFVTCDLGHHDVAPDGSSFRQRWYIRPASSGELRIDAYAIGGNPAEGGALVAELFDPRGGMLATAQVTYPSAAAQARPNVGSLRASVTALAPHRLEISLAPAPGMAQAHHYRLGFSGVTVEVGLNSPALPHWLEGLNFGRQLFHVHLDAREELHLALTAGEGQPIPSFTLELRGEDDLLLTSRTWSTRDPFEVVLAPASGPRSLRVVTFGNHHFTLAKTSGTDRGIYFDACPPPVPR